MAISYIPKDYNSSSSSSLKTWIHWHRFNLYSRYLFFSLASDGPRTSWMIATNECTVAGWRTPFYHCLAATSWIRRRRWWLEKVWTHREFNNPFFGWFSATMYIILVGLYARSVTIYLSTYLTASIRSILPSALAATLAIVYIIAIDRDRVQAAD